jgi:hypothetical protein
LTNLTIYLVGSYEALIYLNWKKSAGYDLGGIFSGNFAGYDFGLLITTFLSLYCFNQS